MIYLDASAAAPLFVAEARSAEAEAAIRHQIVALSALAVAEVSSAMSRRVRERSLSKTAAESILSAFDAWSAAGVTRIEVTPADFIAATAFVRRFDLGLRTPDALHLAIARRLGATMLSFDLKLVAAARALGVPVA